MRFDRLDLNLLVALDMLFEEANVTAAARRLNLSQSATSGALTRLRDYFGDDLLVQTGGRMVLTARAEELRQPVREALMFIRDRIAKAPGFDPREDERVIKLATSDYMLDVALIPFLRTLEYAAPRVSVDVSLPSFGMSGQLHRGELDMIVSVSDLLEDRYPKITLFRDDHVVVAWKDNPALSQGLNAELFHDLPQVIVQFGDHRSPAHMERYFEREHVARRIVSTVPFFAAIPPLIVGTSRIATMMRRQAEMYAKVLPINLYPVPFPVPDLHEVVQYHSARGNDPALKWFVEALKDFIETITGQTTIDIADKKVD